MAAELAAGEVADPASSFQAAQKLRSVACCAACSKSCLSKEVALRKACRLASVNSHTGSWLAQVSATFPEKRS